MKTPDWKTVELPAREGFQVSLEFYPEDHLSPREHFISECGWSDEEYKPISNFYWFSACVSVCKAGVELGTNHLGGCCHKNKADAMEGEGLSGYLPQMIDEAMCDARPALAKLVESTREKLTALTA